MKFYPTQLKITGTAFLVVVLWFLLGTVTTYAQFNPAINYQGKLLDGSSATVNNGNYDMVFRLYTAASGGSAIWTESRTGGNAVTVTSGLFSVMLGELSSLSSVDFDQTLYLGVTVGGDSEMTPRKILGAVPAAFVAGRALDSDTVGGVASSSFVRTDTEGEIEASSSGTLFSFIQNGAGAIARFFSGATEVFTILNNGNVGIGTTDPDRRLTVVAGSDGQGIQVRRSTTTDGAYGEIGFRVTTSEGINWSGIRGVRGTGTAQLDLALFSGFGSEGMRLTRTGNVGIGTTTPTSLLTVAGTANITGAFSLNTGTSVTGISTDTSLGTSDNLLSTQGAIKAYVDSQVAASGDGSVTSVGLSAPIGFSVSGSPVTTSGTLGLSFASGYSLPPDASQSNWDTAFSWGDHSTAGYLEASENLSELTNQATARSNLGATTVGANIFTLTNPSAVRFLRMNADNTVSALSASDFRTAIGAGTGDGGGDMLAANNLSELTNVTTARTNLGLGSLATLSNLSTFDTDDLSEGSSNLYSQWATSGSDISFSGGNVGIGTTNPSTLLHVSNGGTNFIFSESTTDAITGFRAANTERNWDMAVTGGGNLRIRDNTGSNDVITIFAGAPANSLRITSGGDLQVGGTTAITNARLGRFANGSASAPAYSFSSDTNTGMFRPGTNQLGFSTNGSERMRILANGNVGIGTTNPSERLVVGGNIALQDGSVSRLMLRNNALTDWEDDIVSAQIFTTGSGGSEYPFTDFGHLVLMGRSDDSSRGDIVFARSDGSGPVVSAVIRADTGNVGIGTTAPSQKLHVAGGNLRLDAGYEFQIGTHHALSLPFDGLHTIAGRDAGSSWTAWTGSHDANDLVYHNDTFYRAKTTTTKEPGVDTGWGDDWDSFGSNLAQSAFGYFAGRLNTGNSQSAFGYRAGQSNTGNLQSAFGYFAGRSNEGHRVTGIGYEATRGNTGNDVVAIGYQAGKNNTTANQFIVQQANINATPLIQGDFSSGNVGIGTTDPQSGLSLGSGLKSTGITIFNTADETTNYEKGFINWRGDVLEIGSVADGSAAPRPIRLGMTATPTGGNINRYLQVQGGTPFFSYQFGGTGLAGSVMEVGGGGNWSASNNRQTALLVNPVSSQTGTAAYTGLAINVTENSLGSGDSYLMTAGANNEVKFAITRAGNVGIGTTTPSERLTVAGTANITGAFSLNTGTSVTGISTDTSLGTSDNLLSTQGAIKAYVDSQVAASGDGSVTSVGLSAPTGFSVSGSPVTTSGTLGLSFASGYSLPPDASQSNWDIAFAERGSQIAGTGLSWSGGNLNIDEPFDPAGTYASLRAQATTKADVGLGNVSNNAQLTIANNLSDLNNVTTARTNLGLGSLATLSNLATFDTDDLPEGSSNLYSQWATSGSDISFSGGNVGIGTTGPGAKLHVIQDGTPDAHGVIIEKASDVNRAALWVRHITTASDRIIADFRNNAGSVLYLQGDGNVGIGTTDPQERLHVGGNIHVSGGNRSIFNRSNNSLAFGTNNTERMRINANGRVAIGTTAAPNALLEVHNAGTTTPSIYARTSLGGDVPEAVTTFASGGANLADRPLRIIDTRNGGSRTAMITHNLDYDGVNFTQGNWAGSSAIRFEDGVIRFDVDAVVTGGSQDVITPTERLRITSSGRIGINTPNPQTALDITQSDQFGIRLRRAGHDIMDIALKGGNRLSFTNVTAIREDMVIMKSSGNVGIGTTTPTSLLTVAGTANITGAFSLNTGTSVTGISTDTSLGTSDNLLSTQGAIKAYVDSQVAASGDGSVTSVGLSAPTGFSVSGSPVTTSGTLGLSFASGYSLPPDASQSNWDTAFAERGSQIAGTGLSWSSGNLNVDSTVVRTTGNQTIAGNKTFTGSTDIQALNVGRGNVFIENNAGDNEDGAGITLRTSSNPGGGSEGSVGSIFAIRSSGQALRFWVGQSETTTGINDFVTNDISASAITASSFTGSGASLTNLNANNITSGTLSYGVLPISSTQVSNWDTAYGWGDHGTEGYLTAVTGTNLDNIFSTNGILVRTGANTYSTITDSSSNWDTAFAERGSQIAGIGLSWSGGNLNIDEPFDPAGTYASLRAQGTTAGDVGLGNVINAAQLTVANNLSDLANAATARTNLGLGSLATLSTITNSELTAGTFSNITGTGALNAGSITSGFGNINIGASTFTTTGTITTGLTANRLVTTNGSSQLTSSISAANLRSSVSGTTGTAGNLVFSASPTFTGTVTAPTLRGGTAAGATLTLQGSTHADPTPGTAGILFRYGAAAASEAMRIDAASGNIGIGTIAPAERLHVDGNIHLSGGDRTIFNRFNNSLTLGTSNTARLHIAADGRVGIGTTTPSSQLSVLKTDANPQMRLAYDASRYGTFQIDSAGNLIIESSNQLVRFRDTNVWVCEGAGCPSVTPDADGGYVVTENGIYFGNGMRIDQASSTAIGVYDAGGEAIIIFE